ncbi:hypothetical protein F2P79_013643 [Pimephales promelas]|nr:hypothetical protein F2P79_013643 [Pimephales promelas]
MCVFLTRGVKTTEEGFPECWQLLLLKLIKTVCSETTGPIFTLRWPVSYDPGLDYNPSDITNRPTAEWFYVLFGADCDREVVWVRYCIGACLAVKTPRPLVSSLKPSLLSFSASLNLSSLQSSLGSWILEEPQVYQGDKSQVGWILTTLDAVKNHMEKQPVRAGALPESCPDGPALSWNPELYFVPPSPSPGERREEGCELGELLSPNSVVAPSGGGFKREIESERAREIISISRALVR